MKRGCLAVVLIVGMLALSLWHVHALEELTGQVSGQLAQAEALAGTGDWSGAEELTRQARERWTGRDVYLHLTLDHAVTDDIANTFAETLGFLKGREPAEYWAANARLMEQLSLLGEMERPLLENLL